MTAERRFADRRAHDRGTPDRRASDRRRFARWHSTQPLAVSFHLGNTRHQGLLSDISVTGCLVKSAAGSFTPPDGDAIVEQVEVGIVTFGLGHDSTTREAVLVRHSKNTLGLRFTRELGDALLADIVTLCEAYSIQYRDGRVNFAGDLGSLPAITHLLKCVKAGAVVDLSRARGARTRAAASMKLLRERGAQLHDCSQRLHEALALVAPTVCQGCPAQCSYRRVTVPV